MEHSFFRRIRFSELLENLLPPPFSQDVAIVLTSNDEDALIDLASDIPFYLRETKKTLAELDALDAVEWVLEGKQQLSIFKESIEDIGVSISQLIEYFENIINDENLNNVIQLLQQIEDSLDDWQEVKQYTGDLSKLVSISIEWNELYLNVLASVDVEISRFEEALYDVLEQKLNCPPVLSEFFSNWGPESDIIDLDNDPTADTQFDKLLSFLTPTELDKMTKFNNNQTLIIPTFNQTDRALNEKFSSIHQYLEPLHASIEFLPIPLESYFSIANAVFPTSVINLSKRHQEIEEHWSLLNRDMHDLEIDLIIKKWDEIILFVIERATRILYIWNQNKNDDSTIMLKSLKLSGNTKHTSLITPDHSDDSSRPRALTVGGERPLRLVRKQKVEDAHSEPLRLANALNALRYCIEFQKLTKNSVILDRHALLKQQCLDAKLNETDDAVLDAVFSGLLDKEPSISAPKHEKDKDPIKVKGKETLSRKNSGSTPGHSKTNSIDTAASSPLSADFDKKHIKGSRKVIGSLLMSKINNWIVPDGDLSSIDGVPVDRRNDDKAISMSNSGSSPKSNVSLYSKANHSILPSIEDDDERTMKIAGLLVSEGYQPTQQQPQKQKQTQQLPLPLPLSPPQKQTQQSPLPLPLPLPLKQIQSLPLPQKQTHSQPPNEQQKYDYHAKSTDSITSESTNDSITTKVSEMFSDNSQISLKNRQEQEDEFLMNQILENEAPRISTRMVMQKTPPRTRSPPQYFAASHAVHSSSSTIDSVMSHHRKTSSTVSKDSSVSAYSSIGSPPSKSQRRRSMLPTPRTLSHTPNKPSISEVPERRRSIMNRQGPVSSSKVPVSPRSQRAPIIDQKPKSRLDLKVKSQSRLQSPFKRRDQTSINPEQPSTLMSGSRYPLQSRISSLPEKNLSKSSHSRNISNTSSRLGTSTQKKPVPHNQKHPMNPSSVPSNQTSMVSTPQAPSRRRSMLSPPKYTATGLRTTGLRPPKPRPTSLNEPTGLKKIGFEARNGLRSAHIPSQKSWY